MNRNQATKTELHPRNKHRGSYDFESLIKAHGALEPFVELNRFGNLSINFFDPNAVRTLNAALLSLYYNIEWWEIPASALTPPIPGRADYIHYVADLIAGGAARCLDVGVGASCIYPIIGNKEYGWDFVGSDISESSIKSARQIVERNPSLRSHVELRLQRDRKKIFEGVIKAEEYFDITICNPPFHDSALSAQRGTQRKLRGLGAARGATPTLNFAGESNELWCEGGERLFIERMILESRAFRGQCGWFTSLVSSEDNLAPLKALLHRTGVHRQRVIDMNQGNKRSRILAWHY